MVKIGDFLLKSIQLFITCILDTLYPQTGEAVVRVLERLGVRVEFLTEQTCCGQPAFNAGLRPEARSVAKHTIQVFEQTKESVVIPSGSCTAMIRRQYPELFADDPAWLKRAQALAERTFEFTEYLVDVLGVTDVGAAFPGPVTYHSSCHLLRELNIDRQPKALLGAVRQAGKPGEWLTVLPLPGAEECCGFGGVFSIKHPEISAAMLERKTMNFASTSASVLVSCDAGCITHINGGLHRQGSALRAIHIADVLGYQE
jgi:L-lactate dehydrogenase complex protein LldE